MVGEAHGHAADCWPSGWGPSSSGLWKAGGGSAPLDVNKVWVGRWRGPPLASFQAETLDGVPWSEWAFPGHGCAPDRQDPRWGGRAVRGLWFVALPRSGGWVQPRVDQSGALSSAKGAHRPGNAPRSLLIGHQRPISQPALLWDFPRFHIPQVPGPRLSPAGSSEAFRDTRRSLQRFHLDASLSSPPFAP